MTNPTGDALKASAAQVRHKKRGSTYDVIGVGKMQSEGWHEEVLGSDEDGRSAWVNETIDMREVVVYRSTGDGSLWVRPREEFEDGRFEPETDLLPIGENHPDALAVDRFAAAMKFKLAVKRAEGRGGWQDKAQCSDASLSSLLRGHVEKGDPIDVANFCMMLHQRSERILAALSPVEQAPQPPAPETHLIGCDDGDIPCDRCSGTGNLIKDWDRYVSAKTTEEIEECESNCPDCSGYGRFKADTPSPETRALDAAPTEAPPVESQAAEIARLRSVIREFNCPRPCNHQPSDFTAGQCFDAGECGCMANAALAAEGSAE